MRMPTKLAKNDVTFRETDGGGHAQGSSPSDDELVLCESSDDALVLSDHAAADSESVDVSDEYDIADIERVENDDSLEDDELLVGSQFKNVQIQPTQVSVDVDEACMSIDDVLDAVKKPSPSALPGNADARVPSKDGRVVSAATATANRKAVRSVESSHRRIRWEMVLLLLRGRKCAARGGIPYCLPPSREGTLPSRMDVNVRTGTTKSTRDIALSSVSLASAQGETIVLLMEIQARKGEGKVLEHECEMIVKHALCETEGDAAQRLDGTLKELNGLFKGLLMSRTVEDVHMIVAVLESSGMLHVSHAGRAEAYLMRKGVASQVTEYSSGKPTPAFVHIASGQMELRDTVVCSTQRLLRTLTPAQLSQMAQQDDTLMHGLVRALESDGEHAALGTLGLPGERVDDEPMAAAPPRPVLRDRRG